MKKTTTLFVVLFLTILSSQAQIETQLQTNRQKAENYLNTKGEVCFTFKATSQEQFREIAKFLSIGHKHVDKNDLIAEAYANERTFDTFLEYGLPFEVRKEDNELSFDPHLAGTSPEAAAYSLSAVAAWDTTWDAYPKYSEYVAKMNYYASTYPSICSLESIGTTQSGRELLVLKISDNVSINEGEPEFFYTSSMHGDELVGFPLMIRLIDYLLTNYGTDSEVDNLINNLEIYINPSANPDGSYRTNPTDEINNPIRANDSNQDLNRNYPDNVAGLHDSGIYEDETIAFMNYASSKNFILSANLHGGTELVNYPYDNAYVSQYTHSDGDYYEFIGVEYATHAQNNSPAGYMTVDEDSSTYPSPGVTHGAEWYRVYGGRQDYMNYYHCDKELTLELSDLKWVGGANLPAHWTYNKQAFLDYMKQATYGLQGTITDESGNPVVARVEISGHDKLNNFRMSEPGLGEYQKLLKAGNYNVTYSAPGYVSQTIAVTIADYAKTVQNVTLVATTTNPTATDDELCDSGSVTLNASGSGTLNWYDSIDGSTPVHTGASFTTPSISATTSYYVEDVIAKTNVGNTNSSSSGGNHTTTGRYLIFDCTESVVLEQVTINASSDGEVEIELQDSSGEVIDSRIVFVNSGVQAIDLNFEVPVANDLRLVGDDFSTGGLYRNNSGVSLPYNNGSISIKDSSAGTSYYYFFYDWKIGSLKSAREEVVVTVNPSPEANFTYSINGNEVTFTNTSNNATSYGWDFGDVTGTSTDTNPIYTFGATGTYNVELTSSNPDCGDDIIVIPVTIASLGIETESISNVTVYPNPFDDQIQINIKNTELTSALEVRLFDLRGRSISIEIYRNGNTVALNNLQYLSKGTYFLSISDTTNGIKIRKKLVKI
ncbi:MAG: T9SS type A sorting domain-containing protein [Bacteroidia bacterium]|nr:T9SS type A sorting domain-containing protein [Bacteroidia bacterium]